jgi:phosphogluconate dehydratase
MSLNTKITEVTDRINSRSQISRDAYMTRMHVARDQGPRRAHLSCSNQAHAYAAMGDDKTALATKSTGNIGIVTAYNDMLSAHQPFEHYPELIRRAARDVGGTAQVAGGVPAMCDGVTQGQPGMELSLFSRDVIAMAAGVALSHNVFDSTVYLGVCDKIVPGLVMAAATFGYLPAVFLPAGPMLSGMPNDQKAKVRQQFASGEVDRNVLMRAEMDSYHGPGTCTFYGTANSNQMLMEFMGLHLPGATFVNPGTPLREALTIAGAQRALKISALGDSYIPTCDILDSRSFVNGIIGLMATGGSPNLLLHLIAMARSAGVLLDLQDFSDLSAVIPLIARVYPNGLADINQFHAAGGLGFIIAELLDAGLLHADTQTIAGIGLEYYTQEPALQGEKLIWEDGARKSINEHIVRPVANPFQSTGGVVRLSGNLGTGVMKVSAVAEERRIIEAPIRVFQEQSEVTKAFQANELQGDLVIVVRFQGPKANGMPELHGLVPLLAVMQDRGQKVALVTDGRMSGASGKVPTAIHVSPEAQDGGLIGRLLDGDIVRVDAISGTLNVVGDTVLDRPLAKIDLSKNAFGCGRELFEIMRNAVGPADAGAISL